MSKHTPDLGTALDIFRSVHAQMPATTNELNRLRANLSCGITYLEDGAKLCAAPVEVVANIDGPLFGKQRELLTDIIDGDRREHFSDEELDLLEGLRNLCDNIADAAEDSYHIDCGYGPKED